MTLDIRTFSFLLFLIFEYVCNTVLCVLCSAVEASAGPDGGPQPGSRQPGQLSVIQRHHLPQEAQKPGNKSYCYNVFIGSSVLAYSLISS